MTIGAVAGVLAALLILQRIMGRRQPVLPCWDCGHEPSEHRDGHCAGTCLCPGWGHSWRGH